MKKDIVDLEEALSPDHYLVNYLRRNHSRMSQAVGWDCEWMLRAADEIERLRNALALAVGELSTHGQYTIYSPDQLMQQFIQEARRD